MAIKKHKHKWLEFFVDEGKPKVIKCSICGKMSFPHKPQSKANQEKGCFGKTNNIPAGGWDYEGNVKKLKAKGKSVVFKAEPVGVGSISKT